MSITIPGEIYEGLLGASQESLRPIATEAVYRIRLGLGERGNFGGEGTIPSPKKVEIKTGTEVEKLVKRGLVKKGVKELPGQDEGGFKTYFK